MKSNTKRGFLYFVTAASVFLCAGPVWAVIVATGSAKITNIQYGLVNPDAGTINWYYDDGLGGPAWQGEAWVETSDFQGSADDYYNSTPDGSGLIEAEAATPLAWGWAWLNIATEELYGQSETYAPPGGWSLAAECAMMYDYFNIVPTDLFNIDPIEMTFSFDYEIHLTGQAEPGAGYYSDAMVNMLLGHENGAGDWQLVPDGQSSLVKDISGTGTDSDDVTFIGQLQMTICLESYVNYSITYETELNEEVVPEPAALLLFGLGGLALLIKRKT